MIIFNITFGAEAALVPELTDFIRETVIPAAENDGFHSFILSKIKPHDPEADANTVSLALQMRAPSEKVFDEFNNNSIPAVLEMLFRKWGNRVLCFGTRLDVIHDSNRR